MIRQALWAIAIGATTLRASYADPIEVRVEPGQTMVIRFHQDAAPPAATDTLWASYGGVSLAYAGETVTLYDNLGSAMGSVVQTGFSSHNTSFRTPDSPWVLSSAIVDFTSILAGTFDGRVEVTPAFSAPNGFYRYSGFIVSTADGQGQDIYGTSSLRNLTITSVAVIPEPSTSLVAASCLIVRIVRRRPWAG